MATFDTPIAAPPVVSAAPAAPRATAPSHRSVPTGRRTLGAIATVEPAGRGGDYLAVLLAVASLPLLALSAAIRRRRAEAEARAERPQ